MAAIGSDSAIKATAQDAAWQLRESINRQDWNAAGNLVSAALISQPANPDVLTDAALVNAKLGRLREAAQLMVEAVIASNFDTSGPRVDNAVRALIDVGQLYDAIDLLRQVVEAKPREAKYRRMLIGFLGEAQLVNGLEKHTEQLIRDRTIDIPILIATTETFTRRFADATIEAMLERNPSDQRPRLGMAQEMLERRDADSALSILDRILLTHPDFAPAYALKCRVLVDKGAFDPLSDWLSAAPRDALDFGDYWLSAGDLAVHREQWLAAIRAYSEATKYSPNSSLAWSQLGTSLRRSRQSVENDDEALKSLGRLLGPTGDLDRLQKGIDERSNQLLQLRKQFHEFSATSKRSQRAAVAVAENLFALGRNWEAEAWSAIATTLTEDLSAELGPQRQRILAALATNRDWIDKARFVELSFEFTRLPFPDWNGGHSNRPRPTQLLTHSDNSREILLVDEAVERGLIFFGKTGDQVNGPQVPLHQELGCGGAAIDFDKDGHADLFFRAAGGTSLMRDSAPDAMFRNVNGHFIEVTENADVGDTGFGQGVAAGDFNEDGFVDLFLLNLGENRLYRNNGDGTFHDVSDEVFSGAPKQWSTSGAVLDVDGDGNMDLVAVNYCDATQAIDKPCFDKKTGELTTCLPLQFAASEDHFFRGLGDGTFQEVTNQWTEQDSPGRGLGIIAGMLDSKQLGIYVANDMSSNDYYVRRGQAEDFTLSNIATASGVAVDAQSLTQASMGIATSDFDNDGDLDFYVTGFAREYNILYEQIVPGTWRDSTARVGLTKPTLDMVGFGTVANDLDGDCVDELLVTNGHIGEFGGDAPPYAQPFQLFRQATSGVFEEVKTSFWKGYFAKPHVGRGMWTLDADEDGRSDTVVTHATEAVSLLVNKSERFNQFVGFQLVGTPSNRDATGAIVRFEVPLNGGRASKTLFSIAGNGYLCSSENILRCGTGDAAVIENVSVQWPSGKTLELGSLASNREYLVVENERVAIELTSFESATLPKPTH